MSGTVGYELGNILRADQDGLELPAQRGDERALTARTHFEPRIAEELAHILGEPALVGQRDSQHSRISDTGISVSL